MANKLKKVMKPILKQKCAEAFQAGYAKGLEAGWEKRLLSYTNQIEYLKYMVNALFDKRWIPVSERLPSEADANEEGLVLVRNIGCPQYEPMDWDQVKPTYSSISHWMRLPPPPKEVNDGTA